MILGISKYSFLPANFSNFHLGFGMSEAPCITTLPMNVRRPGSCGILPSNTDAKIIDSNSGKTLGPGKVGELCVRGPQVFRQTKIIFETYNQFIMKSKVVSLLYYANPIYR